MPNKNFHFIVPVWGKEFTRLFSEVCLPMILTPGNIGIFRQRENDRFVIVTNWEDSLIIQESSSYKRLEKMIQVDIILGDGLIDDNSSHSKMSAYYSMGMRSENVVPGETYFIFLTPDSFWPEGTFRRLIELVDQNYRVVMVGGLRVNAETMSPLLRERILRSPDNPVISGTELVRLALANFHQMSNSLNWLSGSQFLNDWPSHIYWVNQHDEYLIAHCFHLHPLMVLSPKTRVEIGTTIDGKFLDNLRYPLSQYYVDQGNIFAIELSPANRSWNQPLGPPSLKKVITFSLCHANSRHWFFFNKRIIFSGNPGNTVNPSIDTLAKKVVAKIQPYRHIAPFVHYLQIFFFINSFEKILNAAKKFTRLLILPLLLLGYIERRLSEKHSK